MQDEHRLQASLQLLLNSRQDLPEIDAQMSRGDLAMTELGENQGEADQGEEGEDGWKGQLWSPQYQQDPEEHQMRSKKGLEIDESEAGEAEVEEPQRQKLDIQVHEADELPVQN